MVWVDGNKLQAALTDVLHLLGIVRTADGGASLDTQWFKHPHLRLTATFRTYSTDARRSGGYCRAGSMM